MPRTCAVMCSKALPFTLLLCVPLLIGCVGHTFPVVRPKHAMDRKGIARARAEEYFVKARDYERRGLPQMAIRFYEMAYEFDPSSAVLRRVLAAKYIQASKYTQALLTLKGGREPDELDAEDKRLLATVYMRVGQYKRAAQVLSEVADKTPAELRSLAMLYESAGDIDSALHYYRAFSALRPDSLNAVLKIGGLLLRQEKYEEAESVLVKLEERFDRPPELLNLLGTIRLATGDTADALNFFRMALIEDSTFEESLRNVAQIHIQREDYDKAIGYYERLHSMQPWGALYGKTLALLYYYDERYDEAAGLLRRLLESDIDDYELHYYLALVAASRDNHDLARLELEKALAIRDSFEEAWRRLCYLAIEQKDFDRALRDARRFAERMGEESASWRMLGYVHNARKEYGKAIEVLKKALEIDSTDAQAWFELGSSYERRKEIDKAAVAFRRVLELRPGDPVTANYLGYMWAEQGTKLDSAKTLLEDALQKDPDNGAYLDSYAWIYYRMGDTQKAYDYILKALEHIDDDPVVFEHLGDILVQKQDLRGALEAYRKSLVLEPEDRVEEIREKAEALEEKLQ